MVSCAMLILLASLLIIHRTQASDNPQKRDTDVSCELKDFTPDVTPVNSTHVCVSWEGLAQNCSSGPIAYIQVNAGGSFSNPKVHFEERSLQLAHNPCFKGSAGFWLRGTILQSILYMTVPNEVDSQSNEYNTFQSETAASWEGRSLTISALWIPQPSGSPTLHRL